MPPKKRLEKELLAGRSSQVVEGQVLKITQETNQPQTSAEPHLTIAETTRPEEPRSNQQLKFKKINNKTWKRRLKQSSRMSWHASIRKMSIYNSCKNKWSE
jgi:hypothetical protein